MTVLLASPKGALVSREDAELARRSSRSISDFSVGDGNIQMTLSRTTGERVEANVPASAIHLLSRILEEMADGYPVTIVADHVELSTIQASKLLGVSRPFLMRLLEDGKIPFRLVGSHRRILHSDLVSYVENERDRRKTILKEMIQEQERLGLYE